MAESHEKQMLVGEDAHSSEDEGATAMVGLEVADRRVGWVYTLRKHELIQDMRRFGLDTKGTLDELRRRMSIFLREGPTAVGLSIIPSPPVPGPTNTKTDVPWLRLSNHQTTITGTEPLTSTVFTSTNTASAASAINAGQFPESLPSTTLAKSNIPIMEPQDKTLRFNFPPTTIPTTVYNPQLNAATRQLSSVSTMNNNIDLLNQIRKWNISFDGKSDAVAFLERIEELSEEYGISRRQLMRALPELLKGQAILWYRNRKHAMSTWNEFLEEFQTFFFPLEYKEDLEEEISRRSQRPQESGRDFIIHLQTLIRRHGGWTPRRELRCIYKRLLPEYRQHIRWTDVTSVIDLMSQVQEYEKLRQEVKTNASNVTDKNARSSQAGTDGNPLSSRQKSSPSMRTPVCWQCGQTGHWRSTCPQKESPTNRQGAAPKTALDSPRN